MNRFLLGGGMIALLLAMVFALVSYHKLSIPLPPPIKVVLATSVSPQPGLIFVAQGQGFFADEGLDVTVQQHPMGLMALQSLEKHEADAASVADYPIAIAFMKGEKIRLVSTLCSSPMNTYILSRSDRGIAQPEDLQDKTIGVTFGASTDFMLDMLLQFNRVPLTTVRKVNLPPNELGSAIVAGRVDAVSGTQTHLVGARKELGRNQVVFYGNDFYTEAFSLVTSEEYVQAQPATVEKLLRAMKRAEEFIRQHPAESRQAMLSFVKMEMPLLEELWPIFQHRLALDQALITTLENQSRWARERGLVTNLPIPDFTRLIYFEGLDKVASHAVTIIR